MDKLISIGKDLLDDSGNKKQQNQQNQQAGGFQSQQEHVQQGLAGQYQGQSQSSGQPLPGGNKAAGGAYGLPGGDDDDLRSAADQAAQHAGSHGDKDLFSGIVGSLTQNKSSVQQQGVDEDDVLSKYKKFFGGEDQRDEKADDKGLGAAAALQALKLFNSGETKGQKDTQGGFLALAMAEASKLFDDKAGRGEVEQGTSKQSVVQQAGEVAMKLYFKNQAEQQGGLVGMASKFLK
ncbi:hypothetical protein D7B24_000931 [Verticillium nonalfalfae]|uniref:DUF7721 domain-containing protein n=1 Tax=Verticillium nonalfalfae TaxID=1051616 RepID=A0A3M9Y1C6_9PEZI|nr:uncharacterized protein D7B24_000931 [Verticillium nonalfalfae]RNJ54074.1 hypothetical protein D7B24_000931 [Verticillium nonalfalfae]